MTVTLNTAAIIAAIANLSISGVDILDTDEIPESADGARQPIIYPNPDGMITNFIYTRQTFGTGATALADVEYTLNFRLCHTKVGAGRGLMDIYPDVITIVVDFLEAVITNDTLSGAAIDFQPMGITYVGVVLDPTGNAYLGADFALRVLEYIN